MRRPCTTADTSPTVGSLYVYTYYIMKTKQTSENIFAYQPCLTEIFVCLVTSPWVNQSSNLECQDCIALVNIESIHEWFQRCIQNLVKHLRFSFSDGFQSLPIFTIFSSQMFNLDLDLSRRRLLSYRNQFIDLLCKSMDWFLYDNGLRHERV